jgi:hypothetical protein
MSLKLSAVVVVIRQFFYFKEIYFICIVKLFQINYSSVKEFDLVSFKLTNIKHVLTSDTFRVLIL